MPGISLSWPQPHHIYYISPGSTAYFFTNNEKFRSFKSKANIHKKEVGPYRGFSY